MTRKTEQNGLKKESNTRQHDDARNSNKDHRLVCEVYADGEGCLRLATTSVIRDGEKKIIDAFAPRVQEYNKKNLGSRFKNIPTRRKNSNSLKAYSTSILGCSKPRANSPLGSSTDRFNESTPEGRDNTPDADIEQHSDDDDGEPLLELESEQFDNLSPGDVAALEDYYAKGVCQVGQLIMKKVLKEWVKVKIPKKQSSNPYNGGKNRETQEKEREVFGKNDPNPGRFTAPDWWPKQDGWPTKGCRHKEPDHLKKPERTILAIKLLSLTGCDETFNVDRLFESTKDIKMRDDQKRMLEQLYQVRKRQQAFQNGEIDDETTIPVYRPKAQPSQKKRKVPANRKRVSKKVKQENRDPSAAAEKPTEGTPASSSESIHSFGGSTTSLAGAKIETQHTDVGYEDYEQAQYAPMDDNGHFDAMMPDSDVTFGTMYGSNHPFELDMRTPMVIPPFEPRTSSMQAPMAFASSDRGRPPCRTNDHYRRRPTSVCKQNSPSYQNGAVPRDVGWVVNDDMYWALRPPIISTGYPHTGLPIGLTDPNNHQHGGLSPDDQERLCRRFNCSNFRTTKQHQEGVNMNGWRPSFNEHPGGLPGSNDQQLVYSNEYHAGMPQSHGLPSPFHGQGGIPHSHGLDVGVMVELMRHDSEDFTPDSSLTRSFGRE